MTTNTNQGRTPMERLRRRYENSETKCPECGYVDDDEDNWRSHIDSQQVVYHHVCPSCDAAREYVFHITK
jgi:hypothetical protein